MKKYSRVIVLGLLLSLVLSVPALAKTTAVEADGKIYYFQGNQSTYVEDGKTFLIGEDSVRIQQPGKPDLTFPLTSALDSSPAIASNASTNNLETTVTTEVVVSDHTAAAMFHYEDQFDRYAQFGLIHDRAQNALYYQGQRVRLFQDSYPLDNQSQASTEHFDHLGTIDVQAQRDLSTHTYNSDGSYDPSGLLTGLRVLSDAEFSSRDLTPWLNPPKISIASSGYPMSPQEQKEFFAPYEELGIVYDLKADCLRYQGQVVRHFQDVQRSNGESMSGGQFKGTMTSCWNDLGTIDVTIQRDYTKPDAQGNGTVIGVNTKHM